MSARDRYPAISDRAFRSVAAERKYGPPSPASFVAEARRMFNDYDRLCELLTEEHDCDEPNCEIRALCAPYPKGTQ